MSNLSQCYYTHPGAARQPGKFSGAAVSGTCVVSGDGSGVISGVGSGSGVGGGQSKLFTALATAAVLEEALKGIAYTKIVAFDGGTNAVEHCVIKDFEQKELGSRCIDAMTQIAAGNGNKDGYSIRAAALDLAKRTERRKILMVLSDGLPSGYFSEAEAIDDVRTAVQAARRRGLLVIPIIYTARTDENVDAYRRMYEKSMIFADSVGMLGEFERLLMKLGR